MKPLQTVSGYPAVPPLHIGTHFKALGGGEAHVPSCEVKNVDPAFAVMPLVALAEPEQETSSGVN